MSIHSPAVPFLARALSLIVLIGAILWTADGAGPAQSHGNVVLLECATPGTGGDLADSRGIRFDVNSNFLALEVRMDGRDAGTYSFVAELRRSSGFTAPVERSIPMTISVPGNEFSTPYPVVHMDFSEVSVSGTETFTLRFINVTGPNDLFFETAGIGSFPCPGMVETDENNVATPTERSDPTGFKVLGFSGPELSGSITGPSSACLGEAIGDNISLSVTNSGETAAGSFFAGVYISSDATITTSDTLLSGGRESVSGVPAGTTQNIPLFTGASVPGAAPTGSVFLGLLVDEFNAVAEGNEADNGSAIPITISACPAISGLAMTVDEAQIPAGAVQVPLTSVPLEALLEGSNSVAGAPVGSIPVGSIDLDTSPVGSIPVGSIDLGSSPVGSIPVGSIPIGSIAFEIPLSSIPISTPGGWEAVLAGTAFQGVPLQNVTVGDVIGLTSVQALTLGEVDLSSAPVGSIGLASIVMGTAPIGSIPLDWCGPTGVLAALGFSCGPPLNVNVNSTTLFALDVAGVPVGSIPVGSIPVGSIDLSTAPLGSIPLGSIPVGSIPVGSIPVGSIVVSSSALAGAPVGSIPIGSIALPSGFSDWCTFLASFGPDCATLGVSASSTLLQLLQAYEAAGLDLASTPVGSIPVGSIPIPAGSFLDFLFGDVELRDVNDRLTGVSFGNILLALLIASDYPWEDLRLDLIGVQDFAGIEQTLHYHVSFISSGTAPLVDPFFSVELPEGFLYVPGSSILTVNSNNPEIPENVNMPLPDPGTGEGGDLQWQLDDTSIAPGSSVSLNLQAWPGLRLGTFTSSAFVSAGTSSASVDNQAPVLVTEHFEDTNDSPATSPIVNADTLIISHISCGATPDLDFYRTPVPVTPGSRVAVFLSHLSNDDDLVMYRPGTAPVSSATPRNIPVGSIPLEDEGIGANNAGEALQPQTLDDIHIESLPVGSISANRSTNDDSVEAVARNESPTDFYTIQVSGYNGSCSDQPYVLRVKVTGPTLEPVCVARSFPHGGTAGVIPAVLPSNLNTLFIVNQKQLGDYYGAAAAGDVITALNTLAGRADLGVVGAVIPVEGDPGVAAAYDAWNASPCSPALANNVVTEITGLIDGIRQTRPTLRFIQIVGSDEIVPMARIPDLTTLSNEGDYAADLAQINDGNALFASAATENLVTDNAYGDRDPIPWLGRHLFVPDEAVGRLVETPAEIVAAVNQYIALNGRLNPASAHTMGYDFLADGAMAIDARLGEIVGTSNATELINETWTRQDLIDAVCAADPADILSLNAHFDHWRALPALGNSTNDESDLFTTQDVIDCSPQLAGRLVMSMGCHGGLNVADVVAPGTPTPDQARRLRDWPQTFTSFGAVYMCNSGYGYGETAGVALSERLNLLLAEYLGDGRPVGEALMFAKQDYFGGMGVYGVYDEKVLSIANFYGPVMYKVGPDAPAAVAQAQSVEPLATDPITGLASADVHSEPVFEAHNTPRGTYYSIDGQTQVTHYRPIQPRTDINVTQPGETAHGALLLGAVSEDNPDFNPVIARPVVDLSAHEPEVNFGDLSFPSVPHSVTTFNSPEGEQQRLVLVPAQFLSTGFSGDEVIGNERLFTSLDVRVLYSDSADHTPPTISSVDAEIVGSQVAFAVETVDDSPATVTDVVILFLDASGTWKQVVLAQTPDTNRWTGGAPVVGTELAVLVQSVDHAGNVGTFKNKDNLILLAPPQPLPGGITVDVNGPPGANGWFVGETSVMVSGSSAPFQVNVDGQGFAPYAGTISFTDDGVHTVEILGSDGSEGEVLVPIDETAPVITLAVPANGATFGLNQSVVASYFCADAGSGPVSCAGTVPNGSPINTSTVGPNSFTVTSVDAAGNSASVTHNYNVEHVFTGFFPPVDNPPMLNVAKAGSTLPLKWNLTDAAGAYTRDLTVVTSVASVKVNCESNALEDLLEVTITSGESGLRYDTANEQYVYAWKTLTSWANSCRRVTVTLNDGSQHIAVFKFKK